jgi:dTDP-glucose 4,6-dehydratase
MTGETGWEPAMDFDRGLQATVDWYVKNRAWVDRIKSGEYRRFYELNYSQRAG